MRDLAGFDDAVLARVDEIIERAVQEGQVPGVVAALARGTAVHVAAAGVMAVGGAPMRRDTLFRISSMTKPMTAAAVLSLVDDGLLDLNGLVDERGAGRRSRHGLTRRQPERRSPICAG
jgi:CubicO group peptidase (beta-lactamase class C family)